MTETVAREYERDDAAQRSALLVEVRSSVLRLLAELPQLPERVRVSVRDITVELRWPTSGPLPPAALAASEALGPVVTDSSWQPSSDSHQITAPTVGTFYRAPEPGAPPFVEVGDSVRPGQQVGILEAMKLMLPVEAQCHGMVLEVLTREGQPVEFGQPLFVIQPIEPIEPIEPVETIETVERMT